MDTAFWHRRWQKQEIGFHRPEVNPLLTNYFPTLKLTPPARIFVPLCGKTVDIHWLLDQGYSVCGAELSELAIQQLFEALNIQPQIESIAGFKHYSAQHIDIFVGDIFQLSAEILGQIDAVYDRAALVALPERMRADYAKQVIALTQSAPQLLIHYEYDQALMDGPPFSVHENELMQLYAHFDQKQCLQNELLQNDRLNSRIRNDADILEKVWLFKTE